MSNPRLLTPESIRTDKNEKRVAGIFEKIYHDTKCNTSLIDPIPSHYLIPSESSMDSRFCWVGPYQGTWQRWNKQWQDPKVIAGEKPIDLAWESLLLNSARNRDQSFVCYQPVPTDKELKLFDAPTDKDILTAIFRAISVKNPNKEFARELILGGSSTGAYEALAVSAYFPKDIHNIPFGNKSFIKKVIAAGSWIDYDSSIITQVIDFRNLPVDISKCRTEQEIKQALEEYIARENPETLDFLFPEGKETTKKTLPLKVYRAMRDSSLLEIVAQNIKPTLIIGHKDHRTREEKFRELAKANSGPTWYLRLNCGDGFAGEEIRNQALRATEEFAETTDLKYFERDECDGNNTKLEFFPSKATPAPTENFLRRQKEAHEILLQTRYALNGLCLEIAEE